MCGIFGACFLPSSELSPVQIRSLVDELFKLSESRGKEAAGIAVRGNDALNVYKRPLSASKMIREPGYEKFLSNALDEGNSVLPLPLAVIGHTRLTTNGLQYANENNQPVVRDGLVAVHNGIITNEEQLWRKFSDFDRHFQVDTEIVLAMVDHYQKQGKDPAQAIRSAYRQVEGTAAISLLSDRLDALFLATNYGSLYLCHDEAQSLFFFASEKFTLEQLNKHNLLRSRMAKSPIFRVRADQAFRVELGDLRRVAFSLNGEAPNRPSASPPATQPKLRILDCSDDEESRRKLRRCRRCVLPETVPFIRFDEDHVCNFCRDYEPMQVEPMEQLEDQLRRFRSKDGEPDCIVMLSGGRDSSYGLYYIKEVLGMNPIAYTYDWGLITDLARRNAARICGKLGVEHVIVSADIARKRRYVRKNIQAWSKRPDLGMIPLFMAGDKQYYYYANRLRQQTGIKPIFVCECPLELTKFKAGFCGIEEGNRRLFDISATEKASLSYYYAKQYLRNPSYINASMIDSAFAFFSSYFLNHEYLFLFRYHAWNEETVSRTLIDDFGWELASDTRSTWRIGDGTAPFYNYIYQTVAGFTENETLRSNQVREGVLTRAEALTKVEEENRPRWKSIEWYARTIGFDLDETLSAIHSMPKLYN